MIDNTRPAAADSPDRGLRRALTAALGAGALAFPLPLVLEQIPALAQPRPDTVAQGESPHGARTAGELFVTEVFRLVNEQRAAHGCGPLAVDPAVARAAYEHSRDMGESGYFAHDTPSGVTPWSRMRDQGYAAPAAENIAEGYRTPQEVVNRWINSPVHRRNILNCSFKATGIGYYDGRSNNDPADPAQNTGGPPGAGRSENTGRSNSGPWWTQDFGYA